MDEKRFRIILALVAVIFAVLFISAFFAVNFLFSATGENENIQRHQQLGREIHQELSLMALEARQMLPGREQIDLNDPETRMIFALHESIADDLEWVSGKETENYNKLMKAETEEEAEYFARKEIAYAVIAQYILMANMTLDNLELPSESIQEESLYYSRIALERKEEFEADRYFLREVEEFYGIKTDKIKEPLEEGIKKYAGHLEKTLENAVYAGEKERAYIEARKTIIILMA